MMATALLGFGIILSCFASSLFGETSENQIIASVFLGFTFSCVLHFRLKLYCITYPSLWFSDGKLSLKTIELLGLIVVSTLCPLLISWAVWTLRVGSIKNGGLYDYELWMDQSSHFKTMLETCN